MVNNSNAILAEILSCLDGGSWTVFAQIEGIDKVFGSGGKARPAGQKANAGILRRAQNDKLEGG